MTISPHPTPAGNQRHIERFALSVPVSVEDPVQVVSNQTTSASNISAGGVFFATETVFPVGTKVTLNISLDFEGHQPRQNAPRFKIEGTVVRTEPQGMAVAFDPDRVFSIRTARPKVVEQSLSMIGILGHDPLLNDLLATRLSQELGQNCAQSAEQDKIFNTLKPDLALIDCSITSVPEILARLDCDHSTSITTPVALFNVPNERAMEVEALDHGVRGIFFRNTSFKLLCKGVSAILDGELWFSREAMSQYLLGQQHQGNAHTQATGDDPQELSPREQEILSMLAVGATNRDIANALFLSLNTVKSHLYNAYKKIDVPNRLQASLWAAKHLQKNKDLP